MIKNKTFLFVGDSITESGRQQDPEHIGNGYVRMIKDQLLTDYPNDSFQVVNKGVGGNRITDLDNRWGEDVISAKADYTTISIGINDVWRQLDSPGLEQVTPEKFEHIYRKLLERLIHSTETLIFLMEPSIIEEDPSSKGNQLLKTYVEIVKKMADEYHVNLVPVHQSFLKEIDNGGDPLTTDGVHMTDRGNVVLAKEWVQKFKTID
ncbi:SGNH/GDSL hydrolase family protein [Jeotgalibacillus terrae]|uniref:SGNH/GDSL hydrolase family protein n=1 Tax=Jeotgalibacillus terrae TaxID=587735 RepID=A0ABW5ZKC8_9BACL|nr:SGNH/GDSL hydrolase family protein [Jeotgalibacillus terrae]MBM7579657.1 lysophospholipase L1-like esterase [Jeotgalibacillus terrae]